MAAAQQQAAVRLRRVRGATASAVASQRSGDSPAKPGDDRAVRRMLAPGERQPAVELGLDACGRGQQAVGGEVVHEAQRRALRTDGVRRRRSRADAEQLERADVHRRSPPTAARLAAPARSRPALLVERRVWAARGRYVQRSAEDRSMRSRRAARPCADYQPAAVTGRRRKRAAARVGQHLGARPRAMPVLHVLPPRGVEQIARGTRGTPRARLASVSRNVANSSGKTSSGPTGYQTSPDISSKPGGGGGMRRNRQSTRYSISS